MNVFSLVADQYGFAHVSQHANVGCPVTRVFRSCQIGEHVRSSLNLCEYLVECKICSGGSMSFSVLNALAATEVSLKSFAATGFRLIDPR